jgi:thiol:disulfide interchange protein DsbD
MMRFRNVCQAVVALVVLVGQGFSLTAMEPEKNIQFQVSFESEDVFQEWNDPNAKPEQKYKFLRGEKGLLVIRGSLKPGFHTFPINIKTPDQTANSSLTLKPNAFAVPLWPVEESQAELVDQPGLGQTFEYQEPFTWKLPILIRPDAPSGKNTELILDIQAQACDANRCYPGSYQLKVPLFISTKEPLALHSILAEQLKKYDETQTPSVKPEVPAANPGNKDAGAAVQGGPGNTALDQLIIKDLSETREAKNSTLWATIVVGMLGGLISLATPCVFPMIPITVSTFLKQAETKHTNPYVMACIYSGTILVVLTLGGVILVSALQAISQHWITNVFLALVFFVFSLSLLGMFDLTLPTWLTDMTYARQSLSNNYVGMIFMALTFSLISFACVGPIYGGFISVNVAEDSAVLGWSKRILGPLAFSLAFALPFFVLALFPRLLKALPKSGSWMNSVKVVMGFLELAAMFKFVRAAELGLFGETTLFTYDLVLGVYVILAISCGLYLLGLYRLPHDHGVPESISVVRLLFSLSFLTLGIYLFPGMFKDQNDRSLKPKGTIYAWTQAFLLPDEASTWNSDFFGAMAQSERENKPLFIDFTGVTCSNCKLNEHNVFELPKIQQLFHKFVTVQLYTDKVPPGVVQSPDAAAATLFKANKLDNNALPYYVVARRKGNTLYVLGKWDDGLIRDPNEFAAFLEKQTSRSIP